MNGRVLILLVGFIIDPSLCFFLNPPLGISANIAPARQNSAGVDIDINFLNNPLKLSFESTPRVGRQHDICDDFILFRAPGAIMKGRKLPKGMCNSCCKIEATDVVFRVYKSGSREEMLFNLQDVQDRKPLNLLRNADTVFFAHGFMEHPPVGSSGKIRDVYLARAEPTNIILVDWSQLSASPWYFHAMANTRIIGKILAKFLTVYHKLGELNIDQVHLIGFSLGAHVVGFAGKYFQETGLKLRRITGLDPALPGYQFGPSTRLSKDDAEFVDIIHTDGGSFGQIKPIGHVDFYPNGGTYYQPGCSYQNQIRQNTIGATISCSHSRSWNYYAESVLNPTNFPAIKCKWVQGQRICDRNTIAYMGIASNKRDEGTFFLTTNGQSPFGRSEVIL